MDTALKNGDFDLDSSCRVYLIDDIEEIIQRCKIVLLVPKGSNIFHRAFGSEIRNIDFTSKSALSELTLYVKEALLQVPCANVEKVELSNKKDNNHLITVTINACNKQGKVEVTI